MRPHGPPPVASAARSRRGPAEGVAVGECNLDPDCIADMAALKALEQLSGSGKVVLTEPSLV